MLTSIQTYQNFFTEDSDEEDYLSDLHDYAINSVCPLFRPVILKISVMPQNYRIIFITRTGRLKKLSEEKSLTMNFYRTKPFWTNCVVHEAVRDQKYLLEFDSENITAL